MIVNPLVIGVLIVAVLVLVLACFTWKRSQTAWLIKDTPPSSVGELTHGFFAAQGRYFAYAVGWGLATILVGAVGAAVLWSIR